MIKKIWITLCWLFSKETNVKSLNEEGITIFNRWAYWYYCKKYDEDIFPDNQGKEHYAILCRANYEQFCRVLNDFSYWQILGGIYVEHIVEHGLKTYSHFPNNIGYKVGDVKVPYTDYNTEQYKAIQWWLTFKHSKSDYVKECIEGYTSTRYGITTHHSFLTIKEVINIWRKEGKPRVYGPKGLHLKLQ